MMDELTTVDAFGQAELVRSGEVSATELVEAAIRRIEAVAGDLNLLAGCDFEAALQRAGGPLNGPLAGVPFLIKDLTPYPGLRHSMGCRLFARNVAADATPLSRRFDEAGLVVLGKTTTSEFGLLGSTETLLEGVTRNPWDRSRSAGGSSGGSSAAVAARLVPVAHASDGGGSIRLPAAMNGVFGLKPTSRRTAPSGVDDMGGLLVEHCVSWSVRDSALMLSLTERATPGFDPVGFVEGPSSERLKIGVYRETLVGERPRPAIEEALSATVELCRSLGHVVVETRPPPADGQQISDAFFTLAGAGLVQLAEMVTPMLGRAPGPDELEPFTIALMERFARSEAGTFERARSVVERAKVDMQAYLSAFDVVLCPTMPVEVPELGTLAPTRPCEELIRRTETIAGYTPIHNMADVPAMSVPLGSSPDGLPTGSHFAASRGDEAKLLRLAYELEAAAPWRDRKPPVVRATEPGAPASSGR